MNPPFEVALATFGLLAVLGFAPARVLGRSRPWAVVLTPVTGALICATAASLCVLTRTPMTPWLASLGLAGWGALFVVQRRRSLAAELTSGEAWAVAAAFVVALVPVVLVDLPPTVSDARSIWWLHAAWFRAGGALASEAMGNRAYGGSLPAHPPLVPAVIAAVWHLDAAYDREVALRVSQLMTACSVASLGFVTTSALASRGRRAALLAAAVTWLAWSAKVTVGLNGLLDLTWAAFLVAGAVLWLAGDTDWRTVAAGALLVAAAILTKSEGQMGALLLLGLAAVRMRGSRASLGLALGAVAGAIGLWRSVVTPNANDTGDLRRMPELVEPGSPGWDRMVEALGDFAAHLGLPVLLGVLVVSAVVVLGRGPTLRIHQAGLVGLLVLAAGMVLGNAAVFALRPEDMVTLEQSVSYRAVIVTRLLVLVDVVLALVSARRALHLPPSRASTVAGKEVP